MRLRAEEKEDCMEKRYVLGADLGTTSVKVGLFDDQGAKVAACTREHQLITAEGGIVEQKPQVYWDTFRQCLADVLETAAVERNAIVALSFSSQGETMLLMDENDEPLGNFIVWMDTRAQEEAEKINRWFSAHEILERTGQGPITSLYPACKVLWLRRNQPELFSKARRMLLLDDYFLFRMTGKHYGEGSNWCTSYMWDINTRAWWPEMLDKLHVDESWLPEMKETGTPLGFILPEVADELGLPQTLLLVTGGLDTSCGTVGVGNVEPGIFSESTGAVLVVCTKVDHVVLDYGGELPCFYGVVPGLYMLHTGAKGGIMFRWLRDNLCKEEMEQAEREGKDAYALMDELAAGVPAGSEGLILLPHFGGAGAPETNQYAKGLLYGLSLQHTKAHIIRAFLEATAMNIRRMIDYAERVTGQPVEEVRTLGGAAKSPLWCQIKADVLGRRVVTMKNTQDAAALGAALIAGVGAGIWPSLTEVAGKIAQPDRVYTPNPENREAYDKALERYELLVDAVGGIAKALY